MPESPTTRALLLGLAALHEAADAAHDGALPPSLELRAILALVHALSDGERKSYDAYWRAALDEGVDAYHSTTANYIRSSTMRIELHGIARSIGLEPRSMELMATISRLRARAKRDQGCR